MPCVYILWSKNVNKFYTGSTREPNSVSRVTAHNSGKTRSTKFGRPWVLISEEFFNDYTSARKREIFLKTGKGRNWILERFGFYKNN